MRTMLSGLIKKAQGRRENIMARRSRGQSVIEYAVLLTVLCAVFVTMIVYLKNAVRAKFLVTQDRINEATR